MKHTGVKFLENSTPEKIEKLESGRKLVTFKNHSDGTLSTEEFDTVLFAIGRNANTATLNLDSAGVKVNPKNGKVLTNEKDESSTPHIFALGDVADGKPELTPPAVMVAKISLFSDVLGWKNLVWKTFRRK
jgi:pyruvate/2-oxoglutarate dehydrogenase complex dihydrolipoamide dehydrogenase (E3) component